MGLISKENIQYIEYMDYKMEVVEPSEEAKYIIISNSKAEEASQAFKKKDKNSWENEQIGSCSPKYNTIYLNREEI